MWIWVIGQHMNPRYAAAVFFARPGFVSGASDEVEITVRGKSCHGAYPESGVDAIVIAAQVVTALQTMVSRTISPLDSAVLTLGTVQGGKACNIICGEVRMTGTLRTLSDKTRVMLKERIAQLASGVAQGMGGDAEVVITPGYGAVYNDDALYARMEPLAAELLGEDKSSGGRCPASVWRASAISRKIRPAYIMILAAASVRRCIPAPSAWTRIVCCRAWPCNAPRCWSF